MGYTHNRYSFDSHFGTDMSEIQATTQKVDNLVEQYYELLDRVEREQLNSDAFTSSLPEYFVQVLEAHAKGELPTDQMILSFQKKLKALQNSLAR